VILKCYFRRRKREHVLTPQLRHCRRAELGLQNQLSNLHKAINRVAWRRLPAVPG
jgi:hypothetical protein